MKLFEREAPESSPEPEPASLATEPDAPVAAEAAAEDQTSDEASQSVAKDTDAQEPAMENKESLAPNPVAQSKQMDSWASTSSVIGHSLVVKGELEAAEDMLIEGRVEGSIRHTAERLIVGPSGTVNADVDARNLIVQGVLEGNIVGSESVTICETAHVKGNIYTARISIADGAQFSGTVDMELANKPRH